MTEQKNSSSPPLGKTRSKTDLHSLQMLKDKMSHFLGEKKNPLMDISDATVMMLMSHYNIQDQDIINTTYMSMVEPENYNRKTSFSRDYGRVKTSLKEIQPFQMLFSEDDITKVFSKDNIMALFSNLEKLDMVPNVALQSLILVSAITLAKKKPEGMKIKMPGAPIQGLDRMEVKKRLSFLLTISQVLFHKSKAFDQLDGKKVSKMQKDLVKIVGEY
eukprot:TRINITY_DN1392_c0_g1_i4.p1 TRINITY_DN1392_c0_g1~~TRINITY_DN1392_c0_g1_i4.p1  ORF type:complete len:217 (-),score=101.71 TRINITY_DN1392_c0_g1_i4:67-717(-)